LAGKFWNYRKLNINNRIRQNRDVMYTGSFGGKCDIVYFNIPQSMYVCSEPQKEMEISKFQGLKKRL
jgi:hypothetical protein